MGLSAHREPAWPITVFSVVVHGLTVGLGRGLGLLLDGGRHDHVHLVRRVADPRDLHLVRVGVGVRARVRVRVRGRVRVRVGLRVRGRVASALL